MTLLIILVGVFQSWGVALSILNLCLISAVMSMGVNIQWGYSGLINFGVMGFLAIGGLAAVLVSVPPVQEAWDAGGKGILLSGIFLVSLIYLIFFINKKLKFKFRWHDGSLVVFNNCNLNMVIQLQELINNIAQPPTITNINSLAF